MLVRGVSKSYDGKTAALDDVDLRVAAGEFVLITGPSGCGKSTLLNVVGTLDEPDSGQVEVAGRDLARLKSPAAFRRHTVGFVFQLHHLLPVLSNRMNVEVPIIGTGLRKRERRQRALDLLDEVAIGHRAAARPTELSGGERQRVAVARALANDPLVLLADEPTGALDTAGRDQIVALLGRLRDTRGMTILMVTHDPARHAFVDRIVEMRDGRVVSERRA